MTRLLHAALAPGHDCPVPPRELATVSLGDGPPVLLVHGFAAFKESWGPLPQMLARGGRRVVAVDLPGWGESPGSRRQPHTAAWYAERLEPLAASLGPLLLVGHSLGSQASVHLALRRPDLVRGLMVLSPQVVKRRQTGRWPRVPSDWAALPVIGPVACRYFFRAFSRNDARLERGFAAVVADRSRWERDPEARALMDEAKRRFRAADPAVWGKALNRALRHDLRVPAARVSRPATILVGEADRITKPPTAVGLAEALPGSALVRVPAVGHLPQWEAPDAVMAAIIALEERTAA